MPAPNLTTLLDFEGQIESAAVTFLEAGLGFVVARELGDSTLVTPRATVQFQYGGPPDNLDEKATSETEMEYRIISGVVIVQIVTDSSAGQTISQHSEYRAKVREMLLRNATNWNASNLSYYELKYLRPSFTAYATEGDFHITALSYEAKFSIKSDAWPS